MSAQCGIANLEIEFMECQLIDGTQINTHEEETISTKGTLAGRELSKSQPPSHKEDGYGP